MLGSRGAMTATTSSAPRRARALGQGVTQVAQLGLAAQQRHPLLGVELGESSRCETVSIWRRIVRARSGGVHPLYLRPQGKPHRPIGGRRGSGRTGVALSDRRSPPSASRTTSNRCSRQNSSGTPEKRRIRRPIYIARQAGAAHVDEHASFSRRPPVRAASSRTDRPGSCAMRVRRTRGGRRIADVEARPRGREGVGGAGGGHAFEA